jgi:CRP/FNR family transcriptional regulator, cyclic AMP receptor protein
MHWNTPVAEMEIVLHSTLTHITWGDVAGYLGGALILLSLLRTTMIPLRAMGAMSNLCFVAYGYLDAVYPMMLLHAALFPLNVVRLHQMVGLVRRVRTAAAGSKTMDWLRPYMHRKHCKAGEVLFRKGDAADRMFYTVSGQFRLNETDTMLPQNVFVGELGMLAPDRRRTQTLECIEAGELLIVSYEQVKMLYFQNPDFGFYLMQLATGRLFQNLSALEQRLSAKHASSEGPPVDSDARSVAFP